VPRATALSAGPVDKGEPLIAPMPMGSDSPPAATPRLTVITTAWNAAATIERALASVLDERDIPLECVVVDDGSTDGTAAVVEALAERDPRVIFVRSPQNGGVSDARNRALDVARGAWLAFLDADDRLLPGAVAALMAPTSDPDVRVVVGQRIWTDGERTWLSPLYDIPDIRLPGRKSIVTHPGLLYYAAPTGKVIDRSLVEGRRFEGRILGDQRWAVPALLRAGDGIEVIADTVYEWSRPSPGQDVSTLTAAKNRSAILAADATRAAHAALIDVWAEIDRLIPAESDRRALRQTYFDRLIRADLAAPMRGALKRRDPEIGRFFEAIATYVSTVPPATLRASDALVTSFLIPARKAWGWLPWSGRQAYWAMLRPVARADPRLSRRLGGGRTLRMALRVVATVGAPIGSAIATAIVRGGGLVRRVRRRVGGS
jgi:glycosyltransferase involved in cell wall biosynthesis